MGIETSIPLLNHQDRTQCFTSKLCELSLLSTDARFQQEFLHAHNAYRKKHSAPPLTLSSDLSAKAQEWADQLLSKKSLEHSSTEDGENIFYKSSSKPMTLAGGLYVDIWSIFTIVYVYFPCLMGWFKTQSLEPNVPKTSSSQTPWCYDRWPWQFLKRIKTILLMWKIIVQLKWVPLMNDFNYILFWMGIRFF